MLSQHPHFRGRAGNFEYEYREDVLIVRGRVPTFCLKQVLQTVLKDVVGVACIENRVDVMASAVSAGLQVCRRISLQFFAESACRSYSQAFALISRIAPTSSTRTTLDRPQNCCLIL